jgi:hypothetical protein
LLPGFAIRLGPKREKESVLKTSAIVFPSQSVLNFEVDAIHAILPPSASKIEVSGQMVVLQCRRADRSRNFSAGIRKIRFSGLAHLSHLENVLM